MLLAIADLIGGHWPEQARAAALALSAADEDADTIGVQLLADMRIVFDSIEASSLWTEDLLRHLHAMTEAPWCEYGRARKPISPRQLAACSSRLGSYRSTVRDGEITYKGYRRSQFEDAWARYLFESQSHRHKPRNPLLLATFIRNTRPRCYG